MKTNYKSGRALEYEVKQIFTDAGWDIMRGAGSKGDVFGMKADLIATKQTGNKKKTAVMCVIQCKLKEK